ncbi:glycosyltransferase family 2 protein [Solicola gregarius]|uniref:Glycosyltransferase family 2 protein n=1 Tax=Solicola gregarius TaxID=2908642 RepID=A0AA46YKJ1_9ACTN|nr:glycosyltransferase family A protein [Solicola gregarius]UYM04634.1 glycosyltransferase family 2 protein [Solicola gregarius]
MVDALPGPAGTPQVRRRPHLSVVVPAYNVERYLAECLDSILAQSYEPLDVVIVDDGSTDGTATIARTYADTYPNVRLVPTPNHGLGAARNRGVAESAGELIAFADSDDTVVAGAYDELVGALEAVGVRLRGRVDAAVRRPRVRRTALDGAATRAEPPRPDG